MKSLISTFLIIAILLFTGMNCVIAEGQNGPESTPAAETAVTELKKGSKGDDVKKLQERLNELGYSVGKADGSFGKKTEAAVMAFQSVNGLEETGIADEAMQMRLYSEDALAPTPTPVVTAKPTMKPIDQKILLVAAAGIIKGVRQQLNYPNSVSITDAAYQYDEKKECYYLQIVFEYTNNNGSIRKTGMQYEIGYTGSNAHFGKLSEFKPKGSLKGTPLSINGIWDYV